MHFIFEEGGEIKGASAIGPAVTTADFWQAQTQFGKRIKLKAKEVWLKWEAGDLAKLMEGAKELAATIDVDFLWECSPEQEFSFEVIAKEYFGDKPSTEQMIGLAMALQNSPIYFRRKGRGHFMRAPEEQLKAALLSVERKKQEALAQEHLKEQLLAGILPPEVAEQAQLLLFAPDKNHFIYKALASASAHKGISNAQLLLELGAIHSALEIHQGKFFKEHFPKGVGFPQNAINLMSPAVVQHLEKDLPVAKVAAFSIDDASTTEIDDAFSVTILPNGNYQIGVHIAAPSLVMTPKDALDEVASHRMSTAYFPGGKITMLPKSVVDVFSLEAGQARPALSLYVEVSPSGEIVSTPPHHTVIELVPIQQNLRLHEIEDVLTQAYFDEMNNEQGNEQGNDQGNHQVKELGSEDQLIEASDVEVASTNKTIPFENELKLLWACAKVLFAKRQEVKVANGQRAEQLGNNDPNALLRDFGFSILNEQGLTIDPEDVLAQPVNDSKWQVEITPRSRGSVVDTIVAEWMIFTNQTWGTYLASNELPAIFRAQQGWGAQRTRMQTTPCRHEGLGVENYAWCTSPLRRYADLVNQWQLIALVKNGMMAKLVAPFVPKDTKIMGLCAEFDARYTSYNAYQQLVERYWCLKWVNQQGLPLRVQARTLKDGMIRVEAIPLRLIVPELANTRRGVSVEIEIISTDLLNLNASVRLIELHDQQVSEYAPDFNGQEVDAEEESIPQVVLESSAEINLVPSVEGDNQVFSGVNNSLETPLS